MNTYVALLRAVNLGGRGRLPMARLRDILTGLGAGEVRTYLQSGNAVFTSTTDDAAEVAEAVRAALRGEGLDTEVMIRTGEQLAALATVGHPFAADDPDPTHLQVAFPLTPVAGETVAAMPIPARERAQRVDGEIALHYPDGVGRSKLTTAHLQRHLGTPVTCRNWRTVTALAEWCR
ncbi:DUF1697 domain-containing protein [Saccharopolyspora flava]|uniref:Uncharacterized conserved protein, DUF1697 family n=1 Tax=Saccharopolyspora flava TaxID=95161 RepID=A0A1I6SUJ6_9PSEU|nr:DUF1697 domain-containing protein [Saccharopolyspora flava]SFS80601.1 Uncharacterized conserved protein, DUF1697 family [Saccharopolyspora flava]